MLRRAARAYGPPTGGPYPTSAERSCRRATMLLPVESCCAPARGAPCSGSEAVVADTRLTEEALAGGSNRAARAPAAARLARPTRQAQVTPAAVPPIENLNAPELYLNRELSWLAFDGRVLHEAQDR